MLEEGCGLGWPPAVHHGADQRKQKVSQVPQNRGHTGTQRCCSPLDHLAPSWWKRQRKRTGGQQQQVRHDCGVAGAVVSEPGGFGVIWCSVQAGCCDGVNVLPVTSLLLPRWFLAPPVSGYEWVNLPHFGAADAEMWFHLSWPLADLRRKSQFCKLISLEWNVSDQYSEMPNACNIQPGGLGLLKTTLRQKRLQTSRQ